MGASEVSCEGGLEELKDLGHIMSEAAKKLTVHREPVEFGHCEAEDCVLCGKKTRTWLDVHTPLCRECSVKPDSGERLALKEAQDKAAKEVIDKVLMDEAKRSLASKVSKCQEADMFLSVSRYVPCGNPGHSVVWSDRDNRPYIMCEACADHAVRSRGMKLISSM